MSCSTPPVSGLRILHLTTELPHPHGASGGAVRQFHLDAQLANLGHEVIVIAPVFAFQERDLRPVETLADVNIRLVGTSRRSTRWREALRAFGKQPALLSHVVTVPFYGLQTEMLAIDMKPAIRREIARGIDVITIDHDVAVSLTDLVPPDIPKILTLHNDTPAYYRARADAQTGLFKQIFRWQAALTDRYVTPYFDAFELLIAVSESDADLLRQRTHTPVKVVPNGTDTSMTPSPAIPSNAAPTVLFTGTMNHPPNHDGILWFHHEVWPKVLAVIPQARLMVVGRHPQSEIVNLGATGTRVEVTGGVPDMAPYYAQATVAIAPLRSGGGTRLKILDALAAARPVVTTTIGCEGLDVVDGVQVLVADDPDRFAERTVELLRDPELSSRIAIHGRDLVEQRYDWQVLGAQYAELLTHAVRIGATESTDPI